MDDLKYNGPHGKWHPVLIAIVGAFIGSGGGIALVFNTPIGETVTRPDPFTGTQGNAVIARVERTERDINLHLSNHSDDQFRADDAALRAAISTLVANQAAMNESLTYLGKNQDRILKKLDAL